jgi:hypothetical protein
MRTRVRVQVLLLGVLGALLSTGCMSIRGHKVPEIGTLQKPPTPPAKAVFLDFTWTMNGKRVRGTLGETVTNTQKAACSDVIASSGLFGTVSVSAPNRPLEPGEYALVCHVNNHGSRVLAALSGFVCGLSLATIPGGAVDHYRLEAELKDSGGAARWQGTYDDKITSVIWLPLFPCVCVPKLWPFRAAEATLKNLYRQPLEDMRKAGVLGQ